MKSKLAELAAQTFTGGGEMGERMRAFDWGETPIGPIEGWSQSLKTAVRILLSSRYPMFVWWGPDLTNIYNDAYVPMLGARHPEALGRSASRIWAEIWDVVGPQTEVVLGEGRATWNESVLLVMERYGFTEETYFTFSYSPAPDDSGKVAGVFCAVTEDTRQVLGERRLKILRDLGERSLASAAGPEQICAAAAATLEANPHDFPFALIYLLNDDGETGRLSGSVNLEAGAAASPAVVEVGSDGDRWGFHRVVAMRQGLTVDDLETRFGRLPAGPWKDDHTRRALVLPLARPASEERPAGFLVVGLSPRLSFDADYRSFLELAAGQLATALAYARSYEEERKRAEALAELDRAKTAFFSNVSHEFRTPLTLMLGPLEELLAEDSSPAPSARKRLEVAYRNSLRLLKLVNTLLDFSRIEAGRIQALYQPTDLAELTTELASVFRSASQAAGLRLQVTCPPLPEPVYVDRDMWEKIVLNLLSNAFKFTSRGGIRISLEPAEDSVVLEVADTGTGIPPNELPHLFERFHRSRDARARSFEGTGIGLSLVKELVGLHGGQVSVESEVDEGSAFRVSIPRGSEHLPADCVETAAGSTAIGSQGRAYVEEVLRWLPRRGREGDADNPARSLPPGAGESSRKSGARILLADDNSDMLDYVRRLLDPHYEVETVGDGVAALERAEQGSFDLILSDVMMPRLDGIGLLRELRSREATRTVPVILLSARAGEEASVEGLEAGADDYLIKPFSARELLTRVGTHLKLQEERRAALEALEEAHRRKDEFLALLAHELRNPLAPIRNAAQVLKMVGGENAKRRWAREVIERQAQHLSRLVDDLLDVSRITRGKIELEREVLDLEVILKRAVETSRPLIESREQQLELSLPEESLRLPGDAVRLVQVFSNLLHNAAKYTNKGGQIRVQAEQEEGQAVVRVRDDGIGLSAELLPRVFDLFTQADGSLDRSQGGLGIGLTLVRQLVELHGGRVEVHSEGPGKGSEFTVRLPREPQYGEGAPTESSEESVDSPASGGLKVLVVEDHPDTAETLTMMLELAGHQICTVGDGPAALQAAAEHQPDVVLCDIGLPGMSGYEVAEELRRSPRGEELWLVAVTGYGHRKARDRIYTSGFDEHLVKPVEPETLAELFASLKNRQPGRGADSERRSV